MWEIQAGQSCLGAWQDHKADSPESYAETRGEWGDLWQPEWLHQQKIVTDKFGGLVWWGG